MTSTTALARQTAADAIGLSKEHADRADAAEARWTELRDEIQDLRTAYHDNAADLEDEGKDGSEVAFAKVDVLDHLLLRMARMGDGS